MHGVTDEINAEGIRKHVHRGNLTISCCGIKSPVAEAKGYLVQVGIQMRKIRQPHNCMKAIALMNSFISGSDIHQRVIDFLKARWLCKEGFEYGKLKVGGMGS